MIEYIIVSAISIVLTPLITYVIAKRLLNNQKDEILDTFEDYIRTKEGQESFYTVGLIFGQGIQKGIGLKGKLRGGKIFGIPIELVQPFIDKFISGQGKEGEKTISGEHPSKGGGKFD